MSETNPVHPAIEAFRQRHEDFINIRDGRAERPDHYSIDVDDLIGAKGEKLEPTEDDRIPAFSDPTAYHLASSIMTTESVDFVDGVYSADEYYTYAERALGKLASRKAEQFCEPMLWTVRGLREPLRTVAIQCIFLDEDPADVARILSTSVETIDFLTELALDALAAPMVYVNPNPGAGPLLDTS